MLVSARGLGRTYGTARGPVVAVEGVDLEVGRGEFVAVCGRSGSGKSTLLGMVGGLCRPSAGSVVVDGTDLYALGPSALADFRAERFGFVFQFGGLLPNLRAIDNVALPALLRGASDEGANGRARGLLERVGLAERWDAYPGELSGGQQRRVAVARALVNRPALLLADEPTNDLDEQAEREVLGLLVELHRAGETTLVVVTHDPALAARADRVVTLRGGRVVAAPSPKLVFAGVDGRAAVAADDAGEAEGDGPFEAGPATLVQEEPTPLGEGFGRFLVGFVGWVAVVAGVLYGLDYASGRWQRGELERRAERRKTAEDLALQQLRADVSDVTYRPDGGYEVTLYLQNFTPGRPVYVLGPEVRAFVQVDRAWKPVVVSGGDEGGRVREVKGGRTVVPLTVRIDTDRYDELIAGYFHVRITGVMVVSATAEPGDDLFERTDDYYVYLKPQTLTDDEVRARNKWKPGAVVPRWIPMPAH